MLYEWVFCSHTLRQIPDLSDREECQEFQLLLVQLLGSQLVDEDECYGFPATLNYRTASGFIIVLVDSFECLSSSLS